MWLLECSKNSWVKTCKTGDQAYSDTSSNDGRVLSCIVQSYARKSRSKHDLSLQIFQLGSFYFNEPVLFLTCLAQVGVWPEAFLFAVGRRQNEVNDRTVVAVAAAVVLREDHCVVVVIKVFILRFKRWWPRCSRSSLLHKLFFFCDLLVKLLQ